MLRQGYPKLPGGNPLGVALRIVRVLGLAVCTGLGKWRKAPTGAPWTVKQGSAGVLETPNRQAGAQRFGCHG